MKRSPTMQDVARASGFSRAAVSMALRGDRTIPEKTRTHIQGVARRLGYRTNPMVASLMSLHRQRKPFTSVQTTIAWLSSHLEGNPWRKHASFVSMFDGARSYAAEKDFAMEEFNLRSTGMTASRMREILDTRNITGLLIGPLPREETRLDFDISHMAVAGLGMSITSPLVTRVANDHFQSAALAIGQCARLGYRRVGFVVCEEDSRRLEHRWLGGYRMAIEQYDFDQRIPPLMPMRDTELPSVLPDWIKMWQPDVVVLNNNEFEVQKLIPASIGMVLLGVDRPDSALSGIWQNYSLLGKMAIEHVINRLYTNNFERIEQAQLHLVSGVWVSGSTAPGPHRRRPSVTTLKADGLVVY